MTAKNDTAKATTAKATVTVPATTGGTFTEGQIVRINGANWGNWSALIRKFDGQWAHIYAMSDKNSAQEYLGRTKIVNLMPHENSGKIAQTLRDGLADVTRV